MGSEAGSGGRMFLLILSLVALLLCAAALANPYWLKKKFNFPSPAVAASLSLPVTLVDFNIGMYYACYDKKSALIGLDEYKCESVFEVEEDELIEDWQWAAGGLGLASAVLSFVAMLISSCVYCRNGCHRMMTATITASYFTACICMVAALLLFNENKGDKLVNTQFGLKLAFDLNWGFWVGVASAGFSLIMAFINLVGSCRSCSRGQRA